MKDFFGKEIQIGDRCIRYNGSIGGLEEVIVLGEDNKGLKILNYLDKEVYTTGTEHKLFNLSAFERQIHSESFINSVKALDVKSGSTGVAAKKLNRDFIGIELDKTTLKLHRAELKRRSKKEMELNTIINGNCMNVMPTMADNSVNLTLTDIPYGEVNRADNGLRTLSKGGADVMTFDIDSFLEELYRVTSGTIIIFCGKQQMSNIHKFFQDKQDKHKGTVRQLIWRKTNPSPMNGQNIYLSGIENAVWFKKRGGTFNAHCKNTVFDYPCGRSKIHPTEKNHDLLKELILDNSNEGDIVFDPCCGSGSHCLVAKENNRQYIGIELNAEWHKIAKERADN